MWTQNPVMAKQPKRYMPLTRAHKTCESRFCGARQQPMVLENKANEDLHQNLHFLECPLGVVSVSQGTFTDNKLSISQRNYPAWCEKGSCLGVHCTCL